MVFPRVSLSVSEQALFLAYGQSRTGKVESCNLSGDVKVEADCSEVVLYLDQLESTELNRDIAGSFRVLTKVSFLDFPNQSKCT